MGQQSSKKCSNMVVESKFVVSFVCFDFSCIVVVFLYIIPMCNSATPTMALLYTGSRDTFLRNVSAFFLKGIHFDWALHTVHDTFFYANSVREL